MKKLLLVTTLSTVIATAVMAEEPKITPALLIETAFVQDLNGSDLSAIAVPKAEAGIEVEYKDIKALLSYEYDEASDNVLLNEAFTTLNPKENSTLKIGQFVTNFGSLKTESIFDPLIKGYVETKLPAVEYLMNLDALKASFAVIGGGNTGFVPAVGYGNDNFEAKISARINLLPNSTPIDIDGYFSVSATELFTIRGEVYIETATDVLGYYAEGIFSVSNEIGVVAHLSQEINSGSMLVAVSGSYQLNEQFVLKTGLGAERVSVDEDWVPKLSLLAGFEM